MYASTEQFSLRSKQPTWVLQLAQVQLVPLAEINAVGDGQVPCAKVFDWKTSQDILKATELRVTEQYVKREDFPARALPASLCEGATEPTASASGLMDIILSNVLEREGGVSILFWN